MAEITTRDDFKNYCLRRLGWPVIEINVDDDQVEDRVTEAFSYYWDYHYPVEIGCLITNWSGQENGDFLT